MSVAALATGTDLSRAGQISRAEPRCHFRNSWVYSLGLPGFPRRDKRLVRGTYPRITPVVHDHRVSQCLGAGKRPERDERRT
jgi:hypothetical protein